MSTINKTVRWTLGVFLISTSSLNAQQATIKTVIPVVDSIYQAFADRYHSPGLAYAIVYDGDVVHTGTLGYTDIQQQIPVTPQSVFRVASMTKSFVAMAIVQLRDAGQLKLDDPVANYIPELKDQQPHTSDAPDMTIRQLLTHLAGFPEDNPWGDRQLDISDKRFMEIIRDGFTFSNAPGVGYEYSNTAYALLGEIVKRVSGQRYDTYIDTNILQPLGMAHTYWEYTKVPDNLLAKGYRWVYDQWVLQPMLDDGAYGAMGGLLSSLDDYAKYTALFLQAWPARNGEDSGPLSRASLREMQQPWAFNNLNAAAIDDGKSCPVVSAYGYGLRWTHDCEKVVTVGHTGGLPGFGSNWIILPDYGLGIICFSNVTYAPTAAVNAQAAKEIIRLTGMKKRAVEVSAVLEQRQDELMHFLPDWTDADKSDIFADNFFLDNYIDMLREESRAAFAKAGKIQKVNKIIAENNLRGTFTIACEHGNIAVYFTLSPESTPRIQQFAIRMVD